MLERAAGVFDRWPNLKIIAPHGGGLIPMLAGNYKGLV
jgi:predicted TIM-barrel fold metal-dependent hydrolase